MRVKPLSLSAAPTSTLLVSALLICVFLAACKLSNKDQLGRPSPAIKSERPRAAGPTAQTATSPSPESDPAPTAVQSTPDNPDWASHTGPDPDEADYYWVKSGQLAYHGYQVIERLHGSRFQKTSVGMSNTYAVLVRNHRIVRIFDDPTLDDRSHPLHSTDFGLVPLLRGKGKQLVVTQGVPRGGTYWIMTLGRKCRVIFDNRKYGVSDLGEGMSVVDEDGDGDRELELAVDSFDFIGGLSESRVPRPFVIFKYDQRRDEYLPANLAFKGSLLKQANDAAKRVNPNQTVDDQDIGEREDYVASRLAVLLQYIYAGEERRGWAFFEKCYKLPDKSEIGRLVKSRLHREIIYRYIYRDRRRSKTANNLGTGSTNERRQPDEKPSGRL